MGLIFLVWIFIFIGCFTNIFTEVLLIFAADEAFCSLSFSSSSALLKAPLMDNHDCFSISFLISGIRLSMKNCTIMKFVVAMAIFHPNVFKGLFIGVRNEVNGIQLVVRPSCLFC